MSYNTESNKVSSSVEPYWQDELLSKWQHSERDWKIYEKISKLVENWSD